MPDLSAYSVDQLKVGGRNALSAGDKAVAKMFAREIELRLAQQEATAARDRTPTSAGEIASDIVKATAAGGIRGASEALQMASDLSDFIGSVPDNLAAMLATTLWPKQRKDTASADLEGFMPGTGLMRRPEDVDTRTLPELASDLTKGFSDYEGKTRAAQFGGTVGEFAGGAAVTPVGGGLMSRVGGSVIPGLLSEGAGQMAEGTQYENLARIGGALAFPVAQAATAPFLRRAAIGPAQETVAGQPGATIRAAAKYLESRGIPVTSGQALGSPKLKSLEGAIEPSMAQRTALTRAALKEAGVTRNALATPDVLQATHSRLGAIFDKADDAVRLAPANDEAAKMVGALNEALADAKIGDVAPGLQGIVDDFVDASARGVIMNADDVGRLRTDLRRKLRLYASQNDQINFNLAYSVNDVLDDMIQRQVAAVDPDLVDDLARARKEYRALLTIERAVNRSGADAANGIITPNALNSALRVREGGQYLRGIGTDLADLGKASAQVLTPAPTVLAGGKRIIGEPGVVQAAREMLPRATARYRQEGLLQPATTDILGTMLARSLRQAGGLEAGGLLGVR